MEISDRIGGDVAQEYIIDSNEALMFKLVRTADDVEEDCGYFHPEMTHQVYGSSEQIFGYRDLEIKLYITAGRLNIYCDVQHDGILEKQKLGDLEPDALISPLASLLPPNTIMDNKSTFIAMLRKETSFRPFGEQMYRHTIQKDGRERIFEVYICDESTPGFVDYFERLQMFVMFYVDAASYLDSDDPRWKYFIVFEKYENDDGSGPMYAVAGYTGLYEFYAYPENKRPRISQMLVLPPFQRLGLGTAMLQTIYNKYMDDPKVLTISVEDPSLGFGNMRLLLDCRNCMKLPIFYPSNIRTAITDQHLQLAMTKLKLNKECVRKVYNVLRLRATDRTNKEEYRSYRLYIKNQLYAPFRRQDKQIAKLEKLNIPLDEINDAATAIPKEKRSEYLHQEYMETEAKFMAIIDNLPKISSTEQS